MDQESTTDGDKIEIEQQFLLRLPPAEADKVRSLLHQKPDKVKKALKLHLNLGENVGEVRIGKQKLYGQLKKLPTIVESYKTHDKVNIFKTADIHQILICDYEPKCEPIEMIHGIAPPLKNAKKKRFRKTLINTDQAIEVESIERELYYLLRTDFEAVSTKFEICQESIEDKENICDNKGKTKSVITKINLRNFTEISLFGNISSGSELSNEESE